MVIWHGGHPRTDYMKNGPSIKRSPKKKANLHRALARAHKKMLGHNSSSSHLFDLKLESWLPLRIRVRMHMIPRPNF